MAKTKQIAKKSTGGAAKRKIIQPSAWILCPRASRSRGPSRSPQPAADIEMAEGLHPSKPTTGVEPVAGRKEGGGGSEGDNVSITSVGDLKWILTWDSASGATFAMMEAMSLLFVIHVALRHARGASQPSVQCQTWSHTLLSVSGARKKAQSSMYVPHFFCYTG